MDTDSGDEPATLPQDFSAVTSMISIGMRSFLAPVSSADAALPAQYRSHTHTHTNTQRDKLATAAIGTFDGINLRSWAPINHDRTDEYLADDDAGLIPGDAPVAALESVGAHTFTHTHTRARERGHRASAADDVDLQLLMQEDTKASYSAPDPLAFATSLSELETFLDGAAAIPAHVHTHTHTRARARAQRRTQWRPRPWSQRCRVVVAPDLSPDLRVDVADPSARTTSNVSARSLGASESDVRAGDSVSVAEAMGLAAADDVEQVGTAADAFHAAAHPSAVVVRLSPPPGVTHPTVGELVVSLSPEYVVKINDGVRRNPHFRFAPIILLQNNCSTRQVTVECTWRTHEPVTVTNVYVLFADDTDAEVSGRGPRAAAMQPFLSWRTDETTGAVCVTLGDAVPTVIMDGKFGVSQRNKKFRFMLEGLNGSGHQLWSPHSPAIVFKGRATGHTQLFQPKEGLSQWNELGDDDVVRVHVKSTMNRKRPTRRGEKVDASEEEEDAGTTDGSAAVIDPPTSARLPSSEELTETEDDLPDGGSARSRKQARSM